MKIIYSDFKKGEVKVKVTSLDDLWYLSQIIDQNDSVQGQTIRKIKIGSGEERSANVIKKVVFMTIEVEKIEFHKYSDVLRVSGVIKEGPEDVQRGTHHTFNVELNSIITVIKKEWLKYQIDKIKEAATDKSSNILILILDREEANFALSKQYGYEFLSELKGEVSKKADEKQTESKFYSEIMEIMQNYADKYKVNKIIVASPAFWKEDFLKTVKSDELKKRIILATCSSADKSAINEVLKRPEVQEALRQDRIANELKLVEEIFKEISKNGLVVYGLSETENATNLGAIKMLLITDTYIRKSRTDGFYQKIDYMMKLVDKIKGEIHIISSENDAGKRLDGLGGIAALLRYRIN